MSDNERSGAAVEPHPSEPASRAAVWIAVALAVVVVVAALGYVVGVTRARRGKQISPSTEATAQALPIAGPTVMPSPIPTLPAVPCPEEARPASPEAAATDLFTAWVGNYTPPEVCARRVATTAVVKELFGPPWVPPDDSIGGFTGCVVSAEPDVYPCFWAYGGKTTMMMQVEKVQGAFVVVAVRFAAPTPTPSATTVAPTSPPPTTPETFTPLPPGQ